jgi:Family of unknown function (DUF6174)
MTGLGLRKWAFYSLILLLMSCAQPPTFSVVNCKDSPTSKGCPNSPDVLLANLEKNYSLWKAQNIKSYSFKLLFNGGGLIRRNYLMTVFNNEFQSAFDIDAQKFFLGGLEIESVKTIEIAFQTLRDAIQNNILQGVVYDSLNVYTTLGIPGLPMSIQTGSGCLPVMADCFHLWQITEFKILP